MEQIEVFAIIRTRANRFVGALSYRSGLTETGSLFMLLQLSTMELRWKFTEVHRSTVLTGRKVPTKRCLQWLMRRRLEMPIGLVYLMKPSHDRTSRSGFVVEEVEVAVVVVIVSGMR